MEPGTAAKPVSADNRHYKKKLTHLKRNERKIHEATVHKKRTHAKSYPYRDHSVSTRRGGARIGMRQGNGGKQVNSFL